MIVNWFNNQRMSVKIGLGFALVVLLFLAALWKTNDVVGQLQKEYKQLLEVVVKKKSLSEKINIDLLQCRRREKDFVERKNLKYANLVKELIVGINLSLDDLHKIESQLGNQNGVEATNKIRESISFYEQAFLNVVRAMEKAGLDHKSGLQGQFRDLVHELEEEFKPLKLAELDVELLMLRRHEKDFLLRGDEKYVKKVEGQIDILKSKIGGLNLPSDQIEEMTDDCLQYLAMFHALADSEKEVAGNRKKLSQVSEEVEKLINQGVINSGRMLTEGSAAIERQSQSMVRLAMIIALVAVCLSVVIVIIVSRLITGPLRRCVDFAGRAANGDLTNRLDLHQKDEIGILVNSFNQMVENLADLLTEVRSGVEQQSTMASDLSLIAEEVASEAGNTSNKSGTVAAAAEEMSVNTANVATAMAEATNNISTMSAGVEEMSSTIAEVAENTARARTITEQAVNQSESASGKIDELGRAAQEIGKVTEAINAISSQTNLLALNATIEAARAGEAGKGFAVVANEIKELAKQTADATSDIAGRIEAIQNSTNETVSEINLIAEISGEINNIVTTIAAAIEEQAVTTRDLAENAAQAVGGLAGVNDNIAQTSEVSGSIAKDIAEVNQGASVMNDAGRRIQTSSEQLNGAVRNLQTLISRFTL